MRMRISPPTWPRPCRACPQSLAAGNSLQSGPMDRSSPATSTLRSTIIIAFLTVVLLGCGNASARAVQQKDDLKQDWEVQPALWSPRAILIPRSTPAATPDSIADPADTVTLLDSLLADSRKVQGDSAGGDSIPLKGRAAPAPAVPSRKRGAFNISPADSARWPVKAPPPLPGSIIPEHRIVAFYGNPLSKRMGILGELPPDEMLAKLDREVAAWNAADPSTPVQPALHLIAVVAADNPGKSGKYRTRMDSALIEKVYGWARRRNALLFLDIQVGQGTLQEELPRLAPFLKRPDVHLGIDPEFSMKHHEVPGTKIGTYDANDVNYASSFLQDLVTAES